MICASLSGTLKIFLDSCLFVFFLQHLESISLAESKLKHDIIPLLDALGTNETLKELDIRYKFQLDSPII